MFLKIVFAVAGIIGIIAIFYVSWFWRLLIAPMVLILFWDTIATLFIKKKG